MEGNQTAPGNTIRIYNTMTRRDDDIIPENGRKIRVFVCGPTVYDYIHIGNARTFVFFDSLVKFLRLSGYLVFYLQNVTDVDDKIINRSIREGRTSDEIASFYFKEFLRDMERLRVNSVNLYARTSYFIREIIGQIERLMESGHAYVSDDGVYFKISSFPDYGKLSGQKIENLIAGARVSQERNKENPGDFVLWKFRKEGEPYWESPWGEGRPGWHIEDTSITEFFFGESYDIHGGGIDLLFPHHESENAQMRALSHRDYLAKYWIHVGMLNMGDGKMSKSQGNIVSLREIMSNFRPEDVRFFLLNSNYRSSVEFSMESLRESSVARQKIQNLYDRLDGMEDLRNREVPGSEKLSGIWLHLLDNFDTRSFFREVLTFVSETFREIDKIGNTELSQALNFLEIMDEVFCIVERKRDGIKMTKVMSELLKLRDEMRSEGRFDISDRIRESLSSAGIKIEDSRGETRWRIM